MTVSESNVEITFPEAYSVIKLDDTAYYRDLFNKLPAGKAMDFVAASSNQFLFIEVKNCWRYEADNRWRIFPNNQKRDTIPTSHDINDRDSLDIEFSQKVAMSISALVGALTNPKPRAASTECAPYAKALYSQQVCDGQNGLFAILLLEGVFGSDLKTRTNHMIHQDIQKSIRKKLKWLNCTVFVVDTAAIASTDLPFTATRMK